MDPREGTQASTRALRVRQSIHYPRVLRRARAALDNAIDLIRVKLDSLPDGVYQPVPGVPVRTAKRSIGTQSRWTAIEPVLARLGVRSAMDVGANVGYFPIKLAERGIRAVAVEADPRNVRTTTTAVHRNRLDNVAVMELELRPDTVDLLPTTDCTIFLSVWHHLVQNQGFDVATQLTGQLWARTRKVLFFDSGEEEMPESFGLPRFEPTAETWLTNYLGSTCTDGQIEQLGRHGAFDAAGFPSDRALLAVIREGSGGA